jgi:hypothetical protein
VALLPLTVWYGTNAFSPPPDWKRYAEAEQELAGKIQRAEANADKGEKARREAEQLGKEKERLGKEKEEAERVYYGHMFWVAYTVGLLALVVGTFFPVQSVGSGLMFGGLSSLTAGCYSYWDKMGDRLRFGSLVVALAVLLVLGTWRYRSIDPGGQPPG